MACSTHRKDNSSSGKRICLIFAMSTLICAMRPGRLASGRGAVRLYHVNREAAGSSPHSITRRHEKTDEPTAALIAESRCQVIFPKIAPNSGRLCRWLWFYLIGFTAKNTRNAKKEWGEGTAPPAEPSLPCGRDRLGLHPYSYTDSYTRISPRSTPHPVRVAGVVGRTACAAFGVRFSFSP